MQRLKELYREYAHAEPVSVTLLPLSGSARKYYRMSGPDCPPVIGCIGTSVAENRAFVTIAGQFARHGLDAPKVYAVSSDGLAYIQEDLGDSQLFELLKPSLADGNFTDEQLGWLHETMRLLPVLQYKVGEGLDWNVCFPDREMNARMVNFDLNYFKYDFLKLITIGFDEIRLQDDIDRLCRDAVGYEGNTFMYRDFQARNIMIRDGRPCFIDFQGGRRGPVQYDLASFLWNAGTHFSPALRAELEDEFVRSLEAFVPVDPEQFQRRYRLITLVRLLQETAAYGFRGIVERKQLFIDCIPSVVRSLGELGVQCRDSYPYLADLMCRISEEWDGSTIIPGFSVRL